MTANFERMRQRLRDSRNAFDQGAEMSSPDAILEQRLGELASRRLESEECDTVAEVIVARRAGFTFATPVESTGEVRLVEVTSLPGATDVIGGVFQIRGTTYSLIDIAPFFGESSGLEHGSRTLAAVVSGLPGELGIRLDEVIGPRTIETSDLDEGLGERQLPFVSHVTRDLVHVLDIQALMASPKVRISKISP